MGLAEMHLSNGDAIRVKGDVEDVEKMLSDAARSGHSRLAWFEDAGSGAPVGVNPDHVVVLRNAEPAPPGP